MQLRKLCVLSEHVDKVIKHIGDTPITVRAYKYHTEIVWFSLIPYPFSIKTRKGYCTWGNTLHL